MRYRAYMRKLLIYRRFHLISPVSIIKISIFKCLSGCAMKCVPGIVIEVNNSHLLNNLVSNSLNFLINKYLGVTKTNCVLFFLS